MDFVRKCPSCFDERPVHEMYCQNSVDEKQCGWLLMNVMQTPKGGAVKIDEEAPVPQQLYCLNGHKVSIDDFMCMQCGADIETQSSQDQPNAIEQIDEYRIVEAVATNRTTKECFLVNDADDNACFLTLYHENSEPDKTIYKVLEKADSDHIATLIKTGYWENRFYEVSEHITGGSLKEQGYLDNNKIERLVDEIGRALHDFSEAGLRHRDLCPQNILLRDPESFDLVVIDYSSARLSDYDLDTDTPLELTRYTAPESIIGGISPASDWWSLGMIVLEQVTQGTFFEKINNKAFMIHLITRGVDIPSSIDERMLLLLKGLLHRDPLKRWNWEQVDLWLRREYVEAPLKIVPTQTLQKEQKMKLGDETYTNVGFFALAAAEEQHWEEGISLFTSGALASWVQEVLGVHKKAAGIRDLRNREDIPLAWRYSLALMLLNDALPLTWRGQVVIPAWLLGNTLEATQLVESPVPDYLAGMDREKWLLQLKERKKNILQKAKNLGITLDRDTFFINALSTSRVKLKAELELLRRLYPDAHNAGLSDILGNLRMHEEDIILVLSANRDQFIALEQLLLQTKKLAQKSGIDLKVPFYKEHLIKSRLSIFELLNEHLEGFSRCNNKTLDRWADRFRIEKRLPLIPSILCLSIPKEEWIAPPKHEYASSLLRHFEKKVIYASSRGPLVRLIVSKNSSRIDLHELGTKLKSSKKLVQSIVNRSTGTENVDPLCFRENYLLGHRMRRMLLHTANFKRDTGLDSLFMGFPFLITQVTLSHRPRILPILLWPVTLDFSRLGNASLKIGFDFAQGEIRLNPALASSVDPDSYKKLQKISLELLGRQTLSIAEVIDAFGASFPSKVNTLTSHPTVTYKRDEIGTELHPSAVFFNANFTGQAISEDLRLLQKLPHSGTAMEPILKISEPEVGDQDQDSTENDRYTTMAIDPSQDRAVLKSRTAPGIVIEGPPGTGKSQTIVNIISDCIGRGEKVLVVSQKRAAIQVILKRLQAVGLEKRALLVTDLVKDRQPIIRGLREQVAYFHSSSFDKNVLGQLLHKRENIARQIDRVEAELDTLSYQSHLVDKTSGMSYRNILSELISSSSQDFIEAPTLRTFFENNTFETHNVLTEEVSSLIADWMPSQFETSTLENLKITSFDTTTETAVLKDLNLFYEAEQKRVTLIKQTSGKLDTPDAGGYANWLHHHKETLQDVEKTLANRTQKWLHLLYDTFDDRSVGDDIYNQLLTTYDALKELIATATDSRFKQYFNNLEDQEVLKLHKVCSSYLSTSSLKKWNPFYWIYKSRLKKILTTHQLLLDAESARVLNKAVNVERRFRTHRHSYFRNLNTLQIELPTISDPRLLAVAINTTARDLSQSIELVNTFKECPAQEEARDVLASADPQAYTDFGRALQEASDRYQHRLRSLEKLAVIEQWLTPQATSQCENAVLNNETDITKLTTMINDMSHFIPYQKFRVRFKDNAIRTQLTAVFSVLRNYEDEVNCFAIERWEQIAKNTLLREGLLAWKQRIERSHPAMLMNSLEVRQKINRLEKNLTNIKTLNRQVLASNYTFDNIASLSQWNGITRLRGANYKKLREFISLGEPLGLLELRPVWLMNPEVVSQALPLQSGMFDVVIFDEASQMLVDHAIPALFRAKRVIISGDEKQMPPTGFFTKKMEEDEDEDAAQTLMDEDYSEEERVAYQDSWNKKEVKDSPDLLSLAKTILPTTTLQIHYRSKYKALINYSNNAFYDGMLQIPAHHPQEEIAIAKPIEVLRVNGIYEDQTNPDEADTLINYLAQHWTLAEQERLSTGIVTFNKKQAELIEDRIEQRAEDDESFRQALTIARNRQQEGEDMGFFVKNVENVQGDERDMILFSTTFGYNSLGAFRRNFGALGHRGGERRLNVAITRARSKVVIATSMPIQAISDILATGRSVSKPRDYIQTYLNYAEIYANDNIEMAIKSLKQLSAHTKSLQLSTRSDGFKNVIKQYITSLGYETVEDQENSVFYLDLAIKAKNSDQFVLGIECDAPYNPLLANARYRELWRPSVLRRSISHIYRTTSYQWFENTEGEQLRLKKAIEMALNLNE